MGQLRKALAAASHLTLAVLGDTVVEMAGMAFGGVMSSAAVSVRLGAEELTDIYMLVSVTRGKAFGFQGIPDNILTRAGMWMLFCRAVLPIVVIVYTCI